MFTVRAHALRVLPPGAGPLRLLHFSDLHMLPWQRRKQEWVRELAALDPDLVVSTGDNLGHPHAMAATARALEPLLPVPGAFVLGSNDRYAPQLKNPARYLLGPSDSRDTGETPNLPTAELRALLSSGSWVDVDNARTRLEVAGVPVSVVGVDDPHMGMAMMPAPGAPPGALHLGIAHAPYAHVLDELRADGCDLLLAGHTHGGQLRVPGYGALVTNCDLDTGRARGLHGWPGLRPDLRGGEGSVWLNVSAGLGTSMFAPVRFACRPEVSLLQLLPAV